MKNQGHYTWIHDKKKEKKRKDNMSSFFIHVHTGVHDRGLMEHDIDTSCMYLVYLEHTPVHLWFPLLIKQHRY